MSTLSDSIGAYLDRSAPADWQKAEVARFRARVSEVLEANFRVMAFFQSGSFRHGTAISPYSDVDYIARIHFEDRPQSSTSCLSRLRDVLQEALWEATEVTVSRPTVTILFPGVVARYEITPAYLSRSVGDDDVLLIPSSGGGWQESSPRAHREFIREMDQKHHGGVRQLARLLKAWKYENGVSISSFYLEMRAAEAGKREGSMWSLYALRDIANRLVTSGLADMNDPTGLVQRIVPAQSEWARGQALAQVRNLQADIRGALEQDKAGGDRWEYNQRLRSVWGEEFPYTDPDTA